MDAPVSESTSCASERTAPSSFFHPRAIQRRSSLVSRVGSDTGSPCTGIGDEVHGRVDRLLRVPRSRPLRRRRGRASPGWTDGPPSQADSSGFLDDAPAQRRKLPLPAPVGSSSPWREDHEDGTSVPCPRAPPRLRLRTGRESRPPARPPDSSWRPMAAGVPSASRPSGRDLRRLLPPRARRASAADHPRAPGVRHRFLSRAPRGGRRGQSSAVAKTARCARRELSPHAGTLRRRRRPRPPWRPCEGLPLGRGRNLPALYATIGLPRVKARVADMNSRRR